MRNFVSDERLVYEDYHHGSFSKKLAEWAINNMRVGDELKPLSVHSLESMKNLFKANNVLIPEKHIYSAWYLYNMSYADYPKTLTTDVQRIQFVKETLLDPDCKPEAVLECFVAKMCVMGIPIHWEEYI